MSETPAEKLRKAAERAQEIQTSVREAGEKVRKEREQEVQPESQPPTQESSQ